MNGDQPENLVYLDLMVILVGLGTMDLLGLMVNKAHREPLERMANKAPWEMWDSEDHWVQKVCLVLEDRQEHPVLLVNKEVKVRSENRDHRGIVDCQAILVNLEGWDPEDLQVHQEGLERTELLDQEVCQDQKEQQVQWEHQVLQEDQV